ncbi:MAG: Ig-like domain-containing protein, partial [Gammaproteobacteria bacterium]
PPVATTDSYSLDQDTTLNEVAPGVLGNDTDADEDALTASLVSGPTNGDLTLNSDGSFSYTPNPGFSGADSFSYLANDGTDDSSSTTVTLTINFVNTAPVATADSYELDWNTFIDVTAPGVLDNDTDDDGDTLTAALVSGPSNGMVTLNPDGSFSYTPTVGFSGTDSFSYLANDSTDDSSETTVTLTVIFINTPPVGTVESYTLDMDTTLDVAAPGVLGNDTDDDGDTLTASLSSPPTNGDLTLNPDGSFSYTPTPGFFGSDSFSYIANDGFDDSAPITVSFTVDYVNKLPVAGLQSLFVLQDTLVNIDLAVTDPDGPGPYTYTIISYPVNGVVGSDDSDAAFTYTPNPGYTGPDYFTYIVNDGLDDSAETAVALEMVVELPLVLLEDNFDRPDGSTVGNGWTELEIPGTVGIENNQLKFLSTDDSMNLPMVSNTFARRASDPLYWDFEFDWVRENNEGTYRLFMQLGDSTVMNPNDWDAGVGVNFIWSRLDENEQLGYRQGGTQTPLAEISGPTSIRVVVDITTATYRVMVNGVVVGADIPMDGVLALDTVRFFTDDLNDSNFSGRAFDNVSIAALGDGAPFNRVPEAEDQDLSVYEDSTLDIQLGVTDIDGPGPFTYTVVNYPTNGAISGDDGDATLTYTPNLGYLGTDSFTYTVNDGLVDSAEATISLQIGGPLARLRGVSETWADGITVNEAVLDKPAGVVEGDLMIVVITHGANGAVITPPAGWTLVRDDTVIGEIVFPVFQKTAGPAEPDSYTFDISRARHQLSTLLAFRGGAISDHNGANSPVNEFTQVAPSVNAATGDILLYMAAVRADATFTPPAGMTEVTDREETARSLTTAVELNATLGPTGSRSGTSSDDGEWAAALISITGLLEE